MTTDLSNPLPATLKRLGIVASYERAARFTGDTYAAVVKGIVYMAVAELGRRGTTVTEQAVRRALGESNGE